MPLAPRERESARKRYLAFGALNAFSFVLLNGNVITLFAMGFGVPRSTIGGINMFNFATFLLLPLGLVIARRRSLVRVFGVSWILRYAGMLPALAVPVAVLAGADWLAAPLLYAATFLFNAFRGIGLIGNNPVLASLAEGADRGRYMTTVRLVGEASAVATNVLMAVALALPFAAGSAAPAVYASFIAVGIVSGWIASALLLKTPEPVDYRPNDSAPILAPLAASLREKPFRDFIVSFTLVSFALGMGRSFLTPWAKDVFGHGDGEIMAYGIAGSLGAILMGLLSRRLVDRFGAKPLYVIYAGIAFLSFLPAVLSPSPEGFVAQAVFLTLVNLVTAFGYAGADGTSQTWFFSYVRADRTFVAAIAYFLALGVGGSLGSWIGGQSLDLMAAAGLSADLSYRLFFAANALVTLAAFLIILGLPSLGSRRVAETLGTMLSPRDLRTLALLDRLDRVAAPDDEIRLLREIGESESAVAEADLVPYLASPRFDVRMEALLSLESLPTLRDDTVARLVEETRRNTYTTAYVAARMLGRKASGKGRDAAIEALRASLEDEDYMLASSAAVALARLGDSESAARVEDMMTASDNPRVEIACAYALELFGRHEALPSMIALTREPGRPPYVVDELLLSAASLMGRLDDIYPPYSEWKRDRDAARANLLDAARSAPGGTIESALEAWLSEPWDGRPLARRFALREDVFGFDELPIVLSAAVLDPTCSSYEGFRVFAAICAVIDDRGEQGRRARQEPRQS